MRFLVAGAIAAALSTAANSARADDVTAIFERAVAEHDAGKCESSPVGDAALCARAADDFKTVYAMNASALGALRDLAYTERGLGRVASAHAHFRELAEKAPNDPKPERRAWAAHAIEEADALAQRVPYVIVHPPTPAPVGMIVRVDDTAVPLSTPVPLDPGEHRVHAEAPGVAPFDALVNLEERDQKNVDVRWPAPVTISSPPLATPPNTAPLSPEPAMHAAPPHHSHVAPLVIGLAGAGVAAAGLAFGGAALVERNTNCDAQKVCSPGTLDTAKGFADASTVLLIVGGAAFATGIVWYIATPSDPPSSPSAAIVFTPRSASAVVRF